jgi:hypothetical protein
MIDYKELRIGNWIRQSKRSVGVDSNEFDCQVNEINAKGLNVGYGGVYLEWQFCEGIHITPEILEKCGFEHIGSEWRFKADFTECFEVKDGKIFYTGGEGVCYGVGCQYLHELQNLVYSITKKELIYKP